MSERTLSLSTFIFTTEDPRFAELDLPAVPATRIEAHAALVVLAMSQRRRTWKTKSGEAHESDSVDTFRDVFVPTDIVRSPGMHALEVTLEALIPEEPYPMLACEDLRPIAEVSAYRGAMRHQTPSFHGYDFGDTIELAIGGLRGFFSWRGRELGRNVRAFAWPFLFMQYDDDADPRSIVVTANALGELVQIRAGDPLPASP